MRLVLDIAVSLASWQLLGQLRSQISKVADLVWILLQDRLNHYGVDWVSKHMVFFGDMIKVGSQNDISIPELSHLIDTGDLQVSTCDQEDDTAECQRIDI